MLNRFKRAVQDTANESVSHPGRGATGHEQASPRMPEADPIPAPEVVEGNEDSDWALWEDSVAFQDSQMQSGFGELKAPVVRESSVKKPVDEHDPFAFESVRRRAP